MDAGLPRTAVELACNLGEIDITDRPRYRELNTRVRAAMRDRAELPDGYVFSLDTSAVSAVDLAEWIAFERCCPFLALALDMPCTQQTTLSISGPPGAKAFIEAEFAASATPLSYQHSPAAQSGPTF